MGRQGGRVISACLMGVASGAAFGHGENGDYGLVVRNGRIVVGLGDHDTGTVTDLGARVFAAEMSFNGSVVASDEPGVFIPADEFAPGTGIGFDVLAALRVWNASGQHFHDVAGDAMTIEFGPNSVSTPGVDGVVPGFHIVYTGGVFDEHYDFLLPQSAAAGIYLLQLRFAATDPGIAASKSIWTVFNHGMSEQEHDAAIEWAERNVPSPATGMLVGMLVPMRRRGR
ncbi:MAG: hypothetical protein KJZ65_02805 [Phycisphaerales bacterium]|nr:hypothetical protein [Phycisphaerales bacterium]